MNDPTIREPEEPITETTEGQTVGPGEAPKVGGIEVVPTGPEIDTHGEDPDQYALMPYRWFERRNDGG